MQKKKKKNQAKSKDDLNICTFYIYKKINIKLYPRQNQNFDPMQFFFQNAERVFIRVISFSTRILTMNTRNE